MQRLAGPLVLFILFVAVLTRFTPVYGQTSGSGLEQLLQGLSPDQIGSITQQLGTTGTQGASAGQRQTPASEEQQNLMLQQQRDLLQEQQKQRMEMQRLTPFLQAEDWVVITIDSNPLPAAAPPTAAASQAGVLSALGGIGNAQQQQNILGGLASSLAGQGGHSARRLLRVLLLGSGRAPVTRLPMGQRRRPGQRWHRRQLRV